MFYFGARLAQGEVLVFNARLGYPVFVCDSSDPLSANDFSLKTTPRVIPTVQIVTQGLRFFKNMQGYVPPIPKSMEST